MQNDPTPPFTPAHHVAYMAVVRFRERVADAVAATLLISGAALFLFAKQSLTALANGTYLAPVGASYVARADLHAAQSKLGLWLAAAGLALALAAAMSHARARRGNARGALSGASAQ